MLVSLLTFDFVVGSESALDTETATMKRVETSESSKVADLHDRDQVRVYTRRTCPVAATVFTAPCQA
jgi:hypothetical protein